MRTDELTRELRAQAAETLAGPGISMADLRARRSRDRRRTTTGTAVAAAAVLAAASWVGGFRHDAAHVRPRPIDAASATPSPTATPATDWQARDCNLPDFGGCDIPAELVYRGRTFDDREGGRQPLFAPTGLDRELVVPGGRRNLPLLLVGATGTGPGSVVEVTVGDRPARRVRPGRLIALQFPGGTPTERVVVREVGTPVRGETLAFERYAASS